MGEGGGHAYAKHPYTVSHVQYLLSVRPHLLFDLLKKQTRNIGAKHQICVNGEMNTLLGDYLQLQRT